MVLQPIGKASEVLTTEKVLGLVGGCVKAGFPVYISVPTKPGRCHALVHLNEIFANAVASRVFEMAKLEMLKTLERAYQVETDPIGLGKASGKRCLTDICRKMGVKCRQCPSLQ